MGGKEPKSIDALIRSRMRRQQFVNSVLVFVIAAAVICASGYFILSHVDWSRPAPRKAEPTKGKAAPKPSALRKPSVAPAAAVSVAAPAATAHAPTPASVPKAANPTKP